MDRPRPLSVAEAARALQASEAYVRRLLITRRLFGIKVGPVWGVYEEDLESFKRLRRPPGRPRKVGVPSPAVSAAKAASAATEPLPVPTLRCGIRGGGRQ